MLQDPAPLERWLAQTLAAAYAPVREEMLPEELMALLPAERPHL